MCWFSCTLFQSNCHWTSVDSKSNVLRFEFGGHPSNHAHTPLSCCRAHLKSTRLIQVVLEIMVATTCQQDGRLLTNFKLHLQWTQFFCIFFDASFLQSCFLAFTYRLASNSIMKTKKDVYQVMSERRILRAFSLFLLAFAASEVFGEILKVMQDQLWVWFPLGIMSHRILSAERTVWEGLVMFQKSFVRLERFRLNEKFFKVHYVEYENFSIGGPSLCGCDAFLLLPSLTRWTHMVYGIFQHGITGDADSLSFSVMVYSWVDREPLSRSTFRILWWASNLLAFALLNGKEHLISGALLGTVFGWLQKWVLLPVDLGNGVGCDPVSRFGGGIYLETISCTFREQALLGVSEVVGLYCLNQSLGLSALYFQAVKAQAFQCRSS
ncbi:hypothetical protein Tco_0967911 [Tanacetum coccineum]